MSSYQLTGQTPSLVPALQLFSKQPPSHPLRRHPSPETKRSPRSAAEWGMEKAGDGNLTL